MVHRQYVGFVWVLGLVAAAGLSGCGGGSSNEASSPASQATSAGNSGNAAANPAATPAPAPNATSAAPPPSPPAGTSSGGGAPAANPSSAPGTGADTTCALTGFQATALAELNRHRAAGAVCGSDTFPAVAAVSWNATLTQAAYLHSLDMATQNYFSHTSLSGASLSQRVDAQGYAWSTVGENIAAGYTTVSSVIQGWMDSPGHCRNMMNAQFTEIGMACSKSSSSSYGSYYTLNFGRPR